MKTRREFLAASAAAIATGCFGADTPDAKLSAGKKEFPDYEKLLNERISKGITPERNANVLFWKAYGPSPDGQKEIMPDEYFKWMGMEKPPKEGDYFISLHAYTKTLRFAEAGIVLYNQQSKASKRPWKATDYPHVAEWLEANEKPLAVFVEASKRPDYFNPLVAPKNEPDSSLVSGIIAVVKPRELVNALLARAMLHVEEGKFDAAWQDLLACHRLGRLISRGCTMIEALVGYALIQIAAIATLSYIELANLTTAKLRSRMKELQDLPPLSSLADTVDLGERYLHLDTINLIRRGKFESFKGGMGKVLFGRDVALDEQKIWPTLDWEPVVKSSNMWYDRFSAVLRLKSRGERQKGLDKLKEDMQLLVKDIPAPGKKDTSDKMLAEKIGNKLLLEAEQVRNMQNAADRAEQVQKNLLIAFALTGYKKDEGKYPAKLEALAPKYLPAVPDDIFTGKGLIYKPTATGYLFYSVGPNGKDEGGRGNLDNPPGDDVAVRMPQPELPAKKE